VAGWNLWEGNRFAFGGFPPDDYGPVGIKLATPNNIVRKNVFYANGASGVSFESEDVNKPNNNRVYNNSFYHNGYLSGAPTAVQKGLAFADWGAGDMTGNVVKNNIFYGNNKGAIGATGVSLSLQTIVNNWEEAGNPYFVDETIPNPSNPALPDFHLKSNSPCINSGAFLTTTTSSGSGKTMQVKDARYFMNGWGIIEGDTIQLEGQTQTAKITNVNYNTNTITVDTSAVTT